MKKQYLEAELEVVTFEAEDILATSAEDDYSAPVGGGGLDEGSIPVGFE